MVPKELLATFSSTDSKSIEFHWIGINEGRLMKFDGYTLRDVCFLETVFILVVDFCLHCKGFPQALKKLKFQSVS